MRVRRKILIARGPFSKQTNLFGETLPTWHAYEFPKDKYQQFVEVYFSREIKKGNLISRENLLR